MKISIAVALLILAVGAVVGWHDYQQVAAARQSHGKLVAEASRLGIDPSNLSDSVRITKHKREDREAVAKRFAAEFIAFGREREAFEKAAGDRPDEAGQQHMSQRMSDFIERMMSLDAAQMKTLIAGIRSNEDLKDESRQRLLDVAFMVMTEGHPQAMLALFAESPEYAKSDMSGGYVTSSAIARWAKDDPLAALEWIRTNIGNVSGPVADLAKHGLIRGVACQDPRLAFKLIGELGFKDDDAIQNIVGAAQTPEERTATLAALREHLSTMTDEKARDETSAKAIGSLANGVARDGFKPATEWLAAAKLTPAELVSFSERANSSGETGQWVEWLGNTLPPGKADGRIQNLVSDWTKMDYQAAGQWLSTTPDGPAKNTAVRSYAETLSRYQPATAAQWAMSLPPGQDREITLKTIYQNWPKTDPAAIEAAAAFARQHGIE